MNLSYAVAIAYVLADCADKTYKKYEVRNIRKRSVFTSNILIYLYVKKPGGGLGPACVTAGDVFVWQMLASVAVPGLCINRVTWGAGRLLARSRVRGVPLRWGPTVAGLGCIPLIIGPIDHAIDRLMDATYRKWF